MKPIDGMPLNERIEEYLKTIGTYGDNSDGAYWIPTSESFKEILVAARKGLAPSESAPTRDAIIEECAVACESEYDSELDGEFVGPYKACAASVRALKEK